MFQNTHLNTNVSVYLPLHLFCLSICSVHSVSFIYENVIKSTTTNITAGKVNLNATSDQGQKPAQMHLPVVTIFISITLN